MGLIQKSLLNIHEDMLNSTYMEEALRELPVVGYRIVIGAF